MKNIGISKKVCISSFKYRFEGAHPIDDEFESDIEKETERDANSIDDLGHSIQMIFERSFGE